MRHQNLIVRFAVMALVLALPVVAFAQTSRVEGLALQGDYIKDYTGIYTYLSGVSTVGNLVYGELGTAQVLTPLDRGVGCVLTNLWDGKFGAWAVNLKQQTPNLGQGDGTSQPGVVDTTSLGKDPNSNSSESFDIMWGKKMGTWNLGLRLNRSFTKNRTVVTGATTNLEFDNTVANNNLSRNIIGYGAGVGFEMNQNTHVELSGLLQSRTFENTTVASKDDGGSTYQLAGRLMWQWSPNTVVTPVIKLYNFDLSRKTSAPGPVASFDNKLSGWSAGLAGNWTVGTSDLFVLGATFAQNTLTEDENVLAQALPAGIAATNKITETLTPQVFAALETHVNRWLTLRFGANKGAFEKVKWENQGAAPAQTTEMTMSSFHMNLGAGVKLGTLQLDAILANDFPQTLGWVGSGVPGVYFPKVTATYAF